MTLCICERYGDIKCNTKCKIVGVHYDYFEVRFHGKIISVPKCFFEE